LVKPHRSRPGDCHFNQHQPLDLDGWALLDGHQQRMALEPITLAAGDTVRVPLQSPIQLDDHGGLVTLLNPAGLEVDGIAYTTQQAQREGWTLVF
jgi:uncharacterized protein YfaS (alpha-2-macroglobulin family)